MKATIIVITTIVTFVMIYMSQGMYVTLHTSGMIDIIRYFRVIVLDILHHLGNKWVNGSACVCVCAPTCVCAYICVCAQFAFF